MLVFVRFSSWERSVLPGERWWTPSTTTYRERRAQRSPISKNFHGYAGDHTDQKDCRQQDCHEQQRPRTMISGISKIANVANPCWLRQQACGDYSLPRCTRDLYRTAAQPASGPRGRLALAACLCPIHCFQETTTACGNYRRNVDEALWAPARGAPTCRWLKVPFCSCELVEPQPD